MQSIVGFMMYSKRCKSPLKLEESVSKLLRSPALTTEGETWEWIRVVKPH